MLLSGAAAQAPLLKKQQGRRLVSSTPVVLSPRPSTLLPGKRHPLSPHGCPPPTFCIKCHSLVIEPHLNCVIGLKKPLNLEENRRRPKPDLQVGTELRKEAAESLEPELWTKIKVTADVTRRCCKLTSGSA